MYRLSYKDPETGTWSVVSTSKSKQTISGAPWIVDSFRIQTKSFSVWRISQLVRSFKSEGSHYAGSFSFRHIFSYFYGRETTIERRFP